MYPVCTVHGDDANHSTRVHIATGKVVGIFMGVIDENSPNWAKPPQ
jgi:hypothetical protein